MLSTTASRPTCTWAYVCVWADVMVGIKLDSESASGLVADNSTAVVAKDSIEVEGSPAVVAVDGGTGLPVAVVADGLVMEGDDGLLFVVGDGLAMEGGDGLLVVEA